MPLARMHRGRCEAHGCDRAPTWYVRRVPARWVDVDVWYYCDKHLTAYLSHHYQEMLLVRPVAPA